MPLPQPFNYEIIYLKLFSLCTTNTTFLGSGCLGGLYCLHTGKLGVYHNTAAVLAHDDFFTHTNIQLTLRRYLVKATCASIALNIYNTQAVACALADTFERCKQTGLYEQLQVASMLATWSCS